MSVDSAVNVFIAGLISPTSSLIFNAVSLSVILVGLAAFAFYTYNKNKRVVLQIALGGVAVYALTTILKFFFERPRPDLSDNFSFPSRHAALAFFLAALLPVEKKWKALLYVWAALVAFSRLWLNLHWLSDVVFGAGLGIVISYLIKPKPNLFGWIQKKLSFFLGMKNK